MAWRGCRRYPCGLPVGLTRDTRRNRCVPGETCSRDTWRFRRLPVKSHSLDSQCTRGLPGGSYWFGVLGTRGVLARHPGELSRRGIRGHVAAREVSGRGGFTLRHSGQVSHSEGWPGRGGFGRGFERRHSARVRVGSGRLIGRASGTRVSFRKVSGRCGASAGFQKGASGKGFSGGWHRVVRLEING